MNGFRFGAFCLAASRAGATVRPKLREFKLCLAPTWVVV